MDEVGKGVRGVKSATVQLVIGIEMFLTPYALNHLPLLTGRVSSKRDPAHPSSPELS